MLPERQGVKRERATREAELRGGKGGEKTHMPHFIHDRVGVVLRKRHRRALALCRAIRRGAGVRRDFLPGWAKRHGVLLDAREELRLGLMVTGGDELLQRPPDVVDGRGGRDFCGIPDVQELRERTGREAQLQKATAMENHVPQRRGVTLRVHQLQGRSTRICSRLRHISEISRKSAGLWNGGRVATNRIGKRRVEVLKGLAITQCFLVFVCANCETHNMSLGEDQRHEIFMPRDR